MNQEFNKNDPLNDLRNFTPEEVLNALSNFTGTENYYKLSVLYPIKATDGVNFLFKKLNCYWIGDIIGSVQHLKKIKANQGFILWKIKVNPDKSFIIRAYKDYNQDLTEVENKKKYLLYEQKGDYTDFLLKEYEFYQNGEILLLKSEY